MRRGSCGRWCHDIVRAVTPFIATTRGMNVTSSETDRSTPDGMARYPVARGSGNPAAKEVDVPYTPTEAAATLVGKLRSDLDGRVIVPGAEGYEEARTVFYRSYGQ